VETWATPEEASEITSETVTQEQLNAAHPVLVIHTRHSVEIRDKIKPKDLLLLKYAESYQAAWQAQQVDYTGRSDVDNVDHDGLRFTKGDPESHTLAPLAAKSLRSLSWRRTKSVAALTPEQALVLRGVRTAETLGIEYPGGSGLDDDGTVQWRRL
jgi:hypothetical protein